MIIVTKIARTFQSFDEEQIRNTIKVNYSIWKGSVSRRVLFDFRNVKYQQLRIHWEEYTNWHDVVHLHDIYIAISMMKSWWRQTAWPMAGSFLSLTGLFSNSLTGEFCQSDWRLQKLKDVVKGCTWKSYSFSFFLIRVYTKK